MTPPIRAGDVALACRHVQRDELGALHVIGLDGFELVASAENAPADSAARFIAPRWILLCSSCYRAGQRSGSFIEQAAQDFTIDRDVQIEKPKGE